MYQELLSQQIDGREITSGVLHPVLPSSAPSQERHRQPVGSSAGATKGAKALFLRAKAEGAGLAQPGEEITSREPKSIQYRKVSRGA